MNKNIRIVLKSFVQGWFKIEAVKVDANGVPIESTRYTKADWFQNLITNAGLEAAAVGSYLGECRVGSGNNTPNVLDTALETQVAATTTVQSQNSSAESTPPYFGSQTNVYRFDAGVATGNLSEVGIGPPSDDLYSRALILDGGGDPTTITVLSDEVLDVTYQLRLYPPLVDVTGTISIGGDDYDYTIRAMDVTSASLWALGVSGEIAGFFTTNGVVAYDGAIGAITASPSGTSSAASSIVNAAYSATTHRRDATVIFGLDDANFGGGIMSISARFGVSGGHFGGMQIEFDPPIPKTDSDTLTFTFRHVWARKTL